MVTGSSIVVFVGGLYSVMVNDNLMNYTSILASTPLVG